MSTAVTAREWDVLDGAPEPSDADYDRLTGRLDAALDELLAAAPAWLADGATRCAWMLDTTPDEDAWAFQSYYEDLTPVIVITVRAAEEMTHASLSFTLAHELGHALLQDSPYLMRDGELTGPVAGRMRLRAVEPHVNDTLAAYGIHAPACLPVPGGAICGRSAVGFNVAGCSRREIWDTLNGDRSLAELAAIAASRPDTYIADDSGWDAAVCRPHPDALAFWADRRGAFQPEWAAEHDAMHAARVS